MRFQTSDVGQLDTGCTCPKALNRNLCVHRRYFQDYEVESIILEKNAEGTEDRDVAGDKDRTATLFSRRILGRHRLESLYSVQSMSSSELKGRAIVSNILSRSESTWKCSKDTGLLSCYHINKARERYPDVPEDEIEDLEDFVDSSLDSLSIGELARGPGTTVSYLPIHPPFWARIPSDPKLYSDPPPARTPPDGPFPLQADSSCNCGTTRTFFNRDGLKKTKRCKLYTLLTVHDVEIEVQVCPVCPSVRRKRIGPDLRAHGIFNFNNSALVSHELLDEYTSCFTSSETPFTAWYTQLSRRYLLSGKEFMGDDLFRAVWFAYVSLQKFDNDMSCTVCGPSPETVIWDGITLAFGRKHLSGSLRPPTFTMPDSVRRPNVKYKPKQQLLPLATLRRRFRATMERPTHPDRIEDGEEEGGVDGAKSPSKKSRAKPKAKKGGTASNPDTPSKRAQAIPETSTPSLSPMKPQANSAAISLSTVAVSTEATGATEGTLEDAGPTPLPATNPNENLRRRQALLVEDYLEKVDSVTEDMRKECPALAQLYTMHYGRAAFWSGHKPPAVIKNLFRQIAAEESVLQLVNYTALLKLREFVAKPDVNVAYKLRPIPSLNKVINHSDVDLADLLGVMTWIEKKARATLKALIVEPPLPPPNIHILPNDHLDWITTGCFYSMPIIRHRPLYPSLKENQEEQASGQQRGDRCGKYYSQYGERRLTGGIMVCWCSHSICYGFHCIPKAEGRDDVFSAMVTRWPTAPKIVIYDFACALGPYCLLREPMFFANTLFAIDIFHATGHSKCSPAAFLSEYMNVDTKLEYINSSAAECGNGALRRIRKSVSYMGQKRAIIYTKVFLSVWNRLKILKID